MDWVPRRPMDMALEDDEGRLLEPPNFFPGISGPHSAGGYSNAPNSNQCKRPLQYNKIFARLNLREAYLKIRPRGGRWGGGGNIRQSKIPNHLNRKMIGPLKGLFRQTNKQKFMEWGGVLNSRGYPRFQGASPVRLRTTQPPPAVPCLPSWSRRIEFRRADSCPPGPAGVSGREGRSGRPVR